MGMRVAAGAVAVAALVAACTGKGLTPPSGTSGPSTTASAGSSSSRSTQVVSLHSGTAKVRLTGGLDEHLTLPLAPPGASIWGKSTGQISLRYLTRDGDAVLMNGFISGRSAATSTSLTLSIVIQHGGSVVFSSSRGECRVTIARSSTASLRGSFSCSKLRSLGKPRKVDKATGDFSASR